MLKLNARELATVLAALRRWQEHLDPVNCHGGDLREIATACGTVKQLTIEEINALCEWLNRQ